MMKQLSLYLILICVSIESFACRTTKPLTEEAKSSAQVVFIGRPVQFLPLSKDPKSKAQITFVTSKTLKGPHRDEWVINQSFDWFKKETTLKEFKERFGEEVEVGVSLEQGPVIVSTGVCGTPYLIKKN